MWRGSTYVGSVVDFDAQQRKLRAVGGAGLWLSPGERSLWLAGTAATRSKSLGPDRNGSPMPGPSVSCPLIGPSISQNRGTVAPAVLHSTNDYVLEPGVRRGVGGGRRRTSFAPGASGAGCCVHEPSWAIPAIMHVKRLS